MITTRDHKDRTEYIVSQPTQRTRPATITVYKADEGTDAYTSWPSLGDRPNAAFVRDFACALVMAAAQIDTPKLDADPSRKIRVIDDPLTEWGTPWMLITYEDAQHYEVIAIDDRNALLCAELPLGWDVTDKRLEWTECDPIRGEDPEFQAQVRVELEAAEG